MKSVKGETYVQKTHAHHVGLLAALVAISVFKIPVSTVFYGVLLLICPLSHVLMMKFMGGHGHQSQSFPEHQHHDVIDAK